MRLLLLMVSFSPVFAQVCAPPARLQPADSVSGAITESSCRIPDGTAYAEYALVLPRRGRLAVDAESEAFAPRIVVRDVSGHALASGSSVRASLEAGAYRVLVAGAPGEFKLRTGFTPEPNTWCRSFAPIALDDSLTAGLGDGSCRTPDGTRYDAFELTALGPGTLNVSVESGVHPTLVLRDASGRAVVTGDQGQLSHVLSGDASYTLAVLSPEAGPYTLKTAFTPAEGESCRPLKTFTGSGQDAGRMSAGGCRFTDTTGYIYYYTWYQLEVAEYGRAELRATAAGFGPGLELIGPDGGAIAFDASSSDSGQPVLQYPLRPGHYNLLLFSSRADGGDYTLQYTFDPAPAPCQVKRLNSGDQLAGIISAKSSCRTAEGLADIYEFTTPGPGTLEVALISYEFDAFLSLRDGSQSRIVTDDSGAGGTDAYIYADLPGGTYSIAANTLDFPGNYAIAYRFTPHTLATCTNMPTLGEGFNGVLSESSCVAANGQPADLYQFTTTADGTVGITMSSSDVDSFLELTDSEGTVLRRDDNSLGQANAVLLQYLPAGSYRVSARAAESPATFPAYYQILRFESPGDRPAGCNPLRTLAPGETVDARLDLTACEYPGNNFAHVYQVNLNDPARLQVGLSSTELDAYLVLVDGKGNLVGANDDTGQSTNAALTADLGAGSYFVIATSVGGYTSGSYRLSIAQ